MLCPVRTRLAVTLLAPALLLAAPAVAEDAGNLHATYQTYAAGLHVADATAEFGFGRWSYQLRVAFHTTGLVGFFYQAHQVNSVTGSWTEHSLAPHEFTLDGLWRDQQRATLIEYDAGTPRVRTLVPPNGPERQTVPPDLQANTVDTLSALAGMIRTVALSGRCEGSVHTYDGRTATVLSAHTVGTETLEPTGRSIFSGPALRCDFESRILAGFLTDDSEEAHLRPLHGSAWLAPMVPGEMAIPVRMTIGTRWFGEPTVYLTSVGYQTDASHPASAGSGPVASSAPASAGTSVNAAAVAAAPAAIAGGP